jgi:hypothetical protein
MTAWLRRFANGLLVLVAVGASVLWGYGALGGRARVEVTLAKRNVKMDYSETLGLSYCESWPEVAGARFWSRRADSSNDVPFVYLGRGDSKYSNYSWRQLAPSHRYFTPAVDSGTWRASAWPDGSIRRLNPSEMDEFRDELRHQNPPITPPIRYWYIHTIRYWWLVALTAPLPILRLAAHLRRRRVARGRGALGFCISCGYDLRGTPRQCPECGTQPGPPRATAVAAPRTLVT